MSLSELLILMVIGLILFGPEDLPDVARAVGKIVYEIKKMVNEATQEFQETVNTPSKVINKVFDESIKPAFDENKSNIQKQATEEQDTKEPKEELLTYDEAEDKDLDPLAELPADMISHKVEK